MNHFIYFQMIDVKNDYFQYAMDATGRLNASDHRPRVAVIWQCYGTEVADIWQWNGCQNSR